MIITGIMIGSSLDGIDCTTCRLSSEKEELSYQFLYIETLKLRQDWKDRIISLRKNWDVDRSDHLESEFALYLAAKLEQLVLNQEYKPELIVYHGPTIMHQPEKKISHQLGSCRILSERIGIPVLGELRQSDLDLGGRGAPFAPLVDEYFFSDFDYCFNLGGIVNVSYILNGFRIGYDLCGGNQALDYFARKTGMAFDKDGLASSTGKIIPTLLEQFNSWEFLTQNPPKSLSNLEVWRHYILPVDLDRYKPNDVLRTMIEHLSSCISSMLDGTGNRILLTGGGAKNKFLLDQLRTQSPKNNWIVPEDIVVDHKEGLLLCLMGYLFTKNTSNVISSATGASRDSIGGRLSKPSINE